MRPRGVAVTRERSERLDEAPTVRDDPEIIAETTFMGAPHVKRKFDLILTTPA